MGSFLSDLRYGFAFSGVRGVILNRADAEGFHIDWRR
jgi:hypothetical protein